MRRIYVYLIVLILLLIPLKADTSLNFLTRQEADFLYAGGDTESYFFIDNSMLKKVDWNIALAESKVYDFKVYNGVKITPVGGNLQ